MTLGWVLGWYCGLPNEGRRPADCRSEYRPGPRRYMPHSRRELPSTVPAVYAAKPPGIPIHRKPPVLFYVPRRQPWRRNLCHARSATRRGPNRRTQRQDFAFNL